MAVRPPFTIESVHIAWEGAPHAIPLRDPVSLAFLGDQPEWSAAGTRNPAALVGGTRPVVEVTFRKRPGQRLPVSRWRVGARSHSGPRPVSRNLELRFDRRGLAGPFRFRLEHPLPEGPGRILLHWHWHATGIRRHRLNVTRLQCFLTWRPPLSPRDWGKASELAPMGSRPLPRRWVYLPVMKWSCTWARGRTDEKALCDSLLWNLPRSHLVYARPAWSVQDVLNAKGGYCGGMYRLFQALAGSQGVKVERRTYLVDWRVEALQECRWCAIVVRHPGLNRKRPQEQASTFHDTARRHGPVQRRHERRYRFWGHPGTMADGHCINFLKYRGTWFVYDPSFRRRAVPLQRFRPPHPSPHPIAVDGLGTFKAAYLEGSVDHMMGTLVHDGRLFRSLHPDPDHPEFNSTQMRNGLTVRTRAIPARRRDITFYWQV